MTTKEHGFLAEIEMLTNCKHPNIVSLLGFCKEDSNMILVYEHATNGSLQAYMGSTGKYLTWVQRIKICIEIARGLNYLHTKIEDERRIIHRDIKSDNILLGENMEAKIADFGLSKFRQENQQVNTIATISYAGTDCYLDPEYSERGRLSNKIDIYSFGVVLFEMLSGRLANDQIYIEENKNGIAHVARRRFNDRTIKEMVDPRLWEETGENSFALTKGPNQYALHAFIEIAHQCVAETQPERPTAQVIVKKLEEALSFQEGNLKHLEIPLTDIVSATMNFAKTYLIGSDAYGEAYKAELDHFDSKQFLSFEKKTKDGLPKKRSTVTIQRILTREDTQGETGFHDEIEMVTSCNHRNIVSLLGFCEEDGHMILVYEHASNGSLADYLGSACNSSNLTWVQRIKICIDIACGLSYIHPKINDKRSIIHCDIKSGNILLDENWEAKIADFGLSKLHPEDRESNIFCTKNSAGTQLYLDREYNRTHKLTNETNIYSFGVILFEILSGRVANDLVYIEENRNEIAAIAQRRFNDGTIKTMVDPRIMEVPNEYISTLSEPPNEDSLSAFSRIAYQCVVVTQSERPTAEAVLRKLEEALYFQENIKDHLKFSLEDIKLATDNFNDANVIGMGGLGPVYKGEVTHANRLNTIAVKRLDRRYGPGEKELFKELQSLLEYKHENIIGIVGYCFEMSENFILYEYASRGSLDSYLNYNGLTWMKRLHICIDVASGLHFLHGGDGTQETMIHRDIKSANVLLMDDWKAKISDFGLSLVSPINEDTDSVIHNVCGTLGYINPLYLKTGFLTVESDIYSLGVVLFEILCGRLVFDHKLKDLSRLVRHSFNEGKLDEIVFEGIKEQIAQKSLTTFLKVAYQCLHDKREERPTTGEVLLRLKEALDFQEDHEIWEPKLPKDYKEIIVMSNSRDIYSTEKNKNLYDMLSKGILLHQGKVLFSLGNNGEKNEMISARKFSYKHRWSRKWQSVPDSRFGKVAKMLDTTNLQIQVKIKPQFLSPGVDYGVHLVFRFCGPRKSVAKRMYVNFKYKKGSQTLHTYFAIWREDGWMMIELCRFLNDHEEDTEFKFLLESISRCYCETRAIYVEGIEFRAIDNVKHEELSKNLEDVQVLKTNLNMDQVEELPTEEFLRQYKVNKKKSYMISAKEALHESSHVKLSAQFRFQNVIELLGQQVLRIKCKIESQRLSPDTEYACYLVFKLSENCCGLHCPVIVRNLLKRKNKEKGIIYFRFPTSCNVNDIDRVPQEREDGWMEVNVWQFNSSNELRDDCVLINLKLICYEGTMSGLTVSSLEFRCDQI